VFVCRDWCPSTVVLTCPLGSRCLSIGCLCNGPNCISFSISSHTACIHTTYKPPSATVARTCASADEVLLADDDVSMSMTDRCESSVRSYTSMLMMQVTRWQVLAAARLVRRQFDALRISISTTRTRANCVQYWNGGFKARKPKHNTHQTHPLSRSFITHSHIDYCYGHNQLHFMCRARFSKLGR